MTPPAAALMAETIARNGDPTAVLRGAGQDTLSQSRAQGDIAYRLESLAADSTRVHVDMAYALQGQLAQFSRSGIAQDLGRRLVADFAANLNGRLSGEPPDQPSSAPLNIGRFVRQWLADRIQRWFSRGRT